MNASNSCDCELSDKLAHTGTVVTLKELKVRERERERGGELAREQASLACEFPFCIPASLSVLRPVLFPS